MKQFLPQKGVPMKIEYLDEFLTLAKYRNYVIAADMLYLSQSTLTRHVQSLEEFYGVTLFDRNTRKMEITKAGEMLIPYAQTITKMYNEFLTGTEKRIENNNYLVYSNTIVSNEQYLIDS